MKEITKKVYYSDVLGKEFDTPEELNKAEEEKTASDKALATEGNRKKELAKNIDDANSRLERAQKEYEDIRNEYEKKYREIRNEFRRQSSALEKERDSALADKCKEIRQCGNERYDALLAYNREFGVYKRYVTNEEADKEWRRIADTFFDFPSLHDLFINW